jgi:filamentous hemagglutinin family protein
MKVKSSRWYEELLVGLLSVSAIALYGNISPAQSQIVPDDTLDEESSRVTPDVEINGVKSDRIDGGATRGANLFHSFSEFNVGEGQGAYFTNPTGIENILSRVTGGNPSEILGRLGVTGGDANLFLINPNGIIFGANSSLDVGGSFVGTTANGIGLGEDGSFNATQPQTSNLLSVNPSALFFNAVAAQAIVNRSQATGLNGETNSLEDPVGLQVPEGKSLALIGGDVVLEGGKLIIPSGRVELGGIEASGTVGLNIEPDEMRLSFPDDVKRADVLFNNEAEVNVGFNDGGSIAINSENLSFFGGSKLRAGIASGLGTVNSKAGDINIDATGVITLTDESFIANEVQNEALGTSGDINIQAESVFLTDGSYVTTSPYGQGNAGNLTINALDEVRVSGESSDGSEFSRLTTQTEGSVDAGNLEITTKRLTIESVGQISTATDSTESTGDAGNLTINASDEIRVSGESLDGEEFSRLTTRTLGEGNAGDLTINTDNLIIENGGQVSSETLDSSKIGNAGNLTVNALDEVRVNGASPRALNDDLKLSRLTTRTQSSGDAGDLTINTGNLLIENGAQVSSGTNNNSSTGNGGNLTVNALDEVRVSGESSEGKLTRLTSRTEGSGNAGDLTINTGNLLIENGAQVSSGTDTASSTGNGGNLTVNASDEVRVSGESSEESSEDKFTRLVSRTEGSGNAGNLKITTRKLFIQDGGQIESGGFNAGNGGLLKVNASESVLVDNGAISTSVIQSSGGAIDITAGDIRLRGDSDIRTDVSSGIGSAGDINLTADSIVAFDDSDIIASASDGSGGNINLDTPAFFGDGYQDSSLNTNQNSLEGNSQVDINASGAFNGIITLPDVSFIQNNLATLPQVFLNTNDLIASSCIARRDRQTGSFTITGNDSLPIQPSMSNDAAYPTGSVQTVPSRNYGDRNNRPWQKGDPIIEPTGVYRLPNGELVMSRECPQ